MDKLKSFSSKFTGGSSSSSSTTGTTSSSSAGGSDYLDKGVSAAQKKFGMKSDAAKNEEYTDKARQFYESKTGKKVPEKFSN